MIVNDSDLVPESSEKYACKICDYNTCRKSQYERHLATDKHKNAVNDTKMVVNDSSLVPKSSDNLFNCECGKVYKYDSGYYRHKKKCQFENDTKIGSIAELTDKELFTKVILQIPDLVKSIIEISKDKGVNHSHNHTNSHNKTFNLQFFLNETCKDAMNISDFVSSIKPKLVDLENTGRVGYVEGISNIILKNLNKLEEPFRPLHCSDSKREIIYIKDNDEWIKENDNNSILTKAIKVIANENIKNISEWRKEHPDCTDSDSTKNDLYLKIVSNSMCGSTKDEANKNINKIITNIAKEVTIEKK
jgi:hypothetical protein